MPMSLLARAIARRTGGPEVSSVVSTSVPGLTLMRADRPMPPMPHVYKPALCLVAQGAKVGLFGARRFTYRGGQALVVGVEIPGVGFVSEARPERPYLGVIVEFDLAIMRDVYDGLGTLGPGGDVSGGVFVADVDARVADCVLRLVSLIDTPSAIVAIFPAIVRELSYWLLAGPHGSDVAAVVFGADRTPEVVAALLELRARFAETVRVEELAATANMSPSAFHRAFKAMTSMTPIQYQKQLRLLEARNLMLADALSAESAAYRVGYQSASQFSREYARSFGSPPRRDVAGARPAVSAP